MILGKTMKTKTAIIYSLFAVIASCKTAQIEDSGIRYLSKADYDPSRVVKYPVAGRLDEICVLPKHFPGGDYSKGDLEDEKELCSYDFRASNYAICPKVSSTNPALEVFSLPAGVDKKAYESKCVRGNTGAKKLAKYKMSVTCSYTGSILSYYHMSRILGMNNVPPAVIRTFDLLDHKKFVSRGIQHSNNAGNSFVAGNWNELSGYLAKEDKWLLTEDRQQTFGALSVNPRGETRHQNINVGSYSSFMRKPRVKAIFNPAPVSEVLTNSFFSSIGIRASSSNWEFTKAVYGINSMRDISSMILLDTIMGQQDRLGNIHTRDYYYFKKDDGSISRKRSKKISNPSTLSSVHSSIPVPRMILKDNDCGIRKGKSNVFKHHGTLSQITHMSPDTYKRFMWLSKNWSSIQRFLKLETTMATSNFWGENTSIVEQNLKHAKSILYNNCKSGKLILDLDVSAHLDGTNTPEKSRAMCDEVYDPSGNVVETKKDGEGEDTSSGNEAPVPTVEPIPEAPVEPRAETPVVVKPIGFKVQICVVKLHGAKSLTVWKSKLPFKNAVRDLFEGDEIEVLDDADNIFRIKDGYVHRAYTENCRAK